MPLKRDAMPLKARRYAYGSSHRASWGLPLAASNSAIKASQALSDIATAIVESLRKARLSASKQLRHG